VACDELYVCVCACVCHSAAFGCVRVPACRRAGADTVVGADVCAVAWPAGSYCLPGPAPARACMSHDAAVCGIRRCRCFMGFSLCFPHARPIWQRYSSSCVPLPMLNGTGPSCCCCACTLRRDGGTQVATCAAVVLTMYHARRSARVTAPRCGARRRTLPVTQCLCLLQYTRVVGDILESSV